MAQKTQEQKRAEQRCARCQHTNLLHGGPNHKCMMVGCCCTRFADMMEQWDEKFEKDEEKFMLAVEKLIVEYNMHSHYCVDSCILANYVANSLRLLSMLAKTWNREIDNSLNSIREELLGEVKNIFRGGKDE